MVKYVKDGTVLGDPLQPRPPREREHPAAEPQLEVYGGARRGQLEEQEKEKDALGDCCSAGGSQSRLMYILLVRGILYENDMGRTPYTCKEWH